ncbi:MAG: hypothetical protein BWY17_01616 [Deltaproteobacteria bacterium ADurb.Bin207]|mgnify:CR=1 FL=1|jgi:hypothetical protein|nr:MAG: hypothetical protein BWY17_01616 [Deltaproteobacteria bacterium ADurb.Bin207]
MAAKHTVHQRAGILRLAQEVGPLEAAKRKGVPPGTVTTWRCLGNNRGNLVKVAEPYKASTSEPLKRLVPVRARRPRSQ